MSELNQSQIDELDAEYEEWERKEAERKARRVQYVLPKAVEVFETDQRGYPTDPALRRLAKRVIGRLYRKKAGETAEDLIHGMSNWRRESFSHKTAGAVPSIIRALTKGGEIVECDGKLKVTMTDRNPDGTPEARRENFDAFVEKLGLRLFPDEAHKANKVSDLFRRLRAINRVHTLGESLSITVADGCYSLKDAFLVPSEVNVDPVEGPYIAKATIFATRADTGAVIFHQGIKDSLRLNYSSNHTAHVSADISVKNQLLKIEYEAYDSRSLIPRKARSWEYVLKQPSSYNRLPAFNREAAESWLGFSLTKRQWRSFDGSYRNNARHAVKAYRLLMGSLNREAVRAASREALMKIRTYNWFCNADQTAMKRRIQAVEAYPVLTPLFRNSKIASVIDSGGALQNAICKRTGFKPHVIRRLQGLHWQRTTCAMQQMLCSALPDEAIVGILNNIVPEVFPSRKHEWDVLCSILLVERVADLLSAVSDRPFVASLWKDATKNSRQQVLNDLINIEDAIRFMAEHVGLACQELLQDLGYTRAAYIRLVERVLIGEIAGQARTIKTLMEFQERWHRNERTLRRQIRGLKRLATRSKSGHKPDTSWLPLSHDFRCSYGSINWLTNKKDLSTEGSQMRHCVGGYSRECLLHSSHIGSVRGADGGRSTVELKVRAAGNKNLWKLEVWQHQSGRNTEVSQDCKQAVNAFLQWAAKPGNIDFDTLESSREARASNPANKKSREKHQFDTGNRDDCEHLIAILSGIFIGRAAKLSRYEWADRIRAAATANDDAEVALAA